jgi:hypothetical protein
MKTGVEVAMAMAMTHGERTNWEKVSSSYAKYDASKAKSLRISLKEAKKFSKVLIAMT